MLGKSILKCNFIGFVLVFLTASAAFGQGNAFSFQGRLNDGTNPANGSYDLQFRLYDAIAGGTQIGAVVARPNTTLINGVFSVALDFGATAFNNPNSIFIEIAVRPNGNPNAYTILGPRQQLTVVPFSVRAANAPNADNATNAQNSVNATNAQNSVNATTATNSLSLGGVTAGNYLQTNGNGSQLSNVNAVTATTANNSLNLGGFTPSSYARFNITNTGDLRTTGNLTITGNAEITGNTTFTGNAIHSAGANGFVKMMLVFEGGNITRCYNAVTNASTVNCGLIVTQPAFGIIRFTFNFPISGRFFSITPEYAAVGANSNNIGANYRFINPTTLEVFTFETNSDDTRAANFMLIMY